MSTTLSESASVEQVQTGSETSTFLQNIWYYAAHSSQLKRGRTLAKTICGETILLGRDQNDQVFAINNICPHQGMPLHHGRFDGKEVECCFHGWRFDTSGTCTAIPSLVDSQNFNICHIKTGAYPCREAQGNVWVFIGNNTNNLPEIPHATGIDEYPAWHCTKNVLQLPSHIDIAVIGLMDPAHVPFVHNSWWFSSSRRIHPKIKSFVPAGTGYQMVRHQPSKNATAYKLVGGLMETEITFMLPGIRMEHILMGGKTLFTGFTTLTPIDETHTEINHTTYWVRPWMTPLAPIIHYFCHTFLNQDVYFATLQREGLMTKPKNLLMTIRDAGTPVRWYYRLKQEWNASRRENRAFINPLKPETLQWQS